MRTPFQRGPPSQPNPKGTATERALKGAAAYENLRGITRLDIPKGSSMEKDYMRPPSCQHAPMKSVYSTFPPSERFIQCPTNPLHWAGELVGGCRDPLEGPEETPSTRRTVAPRGAGREPWQRSRNGTSTSHMTMMHAELPRRLVEAVKRPTHGCKGK